VLAYADDLVLLAPTAASIRRMLAICDDFARDFHVSFNAAKSKCMMFSPISANSRFSAPSPMFYIGNQVIENVNQWLHLGHMLTNDLDDTADITRRRNSFIGQTNNLLCQFSTLDSLTINRLFTSFCSSHYGCELWNLLCPTIDDYYVTWRIALRRVWRIPQNSHRRLIPLLANCLPLSYVICQRFIRFVLSCLNSDSRLVSSVVRHGLFYARMSSIIGKNIHYCANVFGFSTDNLNSGLISSDIIEKHYVSSLSSLDVNCAGRIFELILVRDGYLVLNGWTLQDINSMIDILLTL
jgi:hypothetical protein